MNSTAKLASNCNKGAWNYCVEHCWHVYQTHRYKFPHLETLLFLNFEMKILNLTQTKRLPNPVLLLFPDSCFDLAGRSLKEKKQEEVKSMSPTLIDEPLCKTGINQRCTFFFLGNVWHVYQLSRHGNPVNIISFERHSLLNFHIKDKYWNWSKKHAAKSWIPMSHPVHLQLPDSCLDLEGC